MLGRVADDRLDAAGQFDAGHVGRQGQAAIQFAVGIVAEAGLSYVGLGAQPPMPSWGRMLAEAQTMIGFAPWLAVMPGLAIFVTVLGLSLTGDGLRDLFDPRVRRER